LIEKKKISNNSGIDAVLVVCYSKQGQTEELVKNTLKSFKFFSRKQQVPTPLRFYPAAPYPILDFVGGKGKLEEIREIHRDASRSR